MNIEKAKIGAVGLIQEQPDGRIVQIGLTEEQSTMLNILVAKMSESRPLMKLDNDYEMILNWKHNEKVKQLKQQNDELRNALEDVKKAIDGRGCIAQVRIIDKALSNNPKL